MPAPDTVASLKQRLAECVEEDGQGRQRLSITLPNRDTLDNLAATLARLLATNRSNCSVFAAISNGLLF